MDKAVVLLSGGLDSTVLLAQAVVKHGHENVIALNMYYGQRHDKERLCAAYQAEQYGVSMYDFDMSEVFRFDCSSKASALLKNSPAKIIHKSYAEQLADIGGQGTVSAYVPFRNGLFLSCAAAIALQFDATIIYYGAHADDAAGRAYPDCTPEFFDGMREAIYEGTGRKVHLVAPWLFLSKAQIVAEGIRLDVDFAHTWSCYEGGEQPCGTCGTCIDRAKAFELNGMTEPKFEGGF